MPLFKNQPVGEIVGDTDAQTLTNKTIGDTLNTTTGNVAQSGAAAHITLTPGANKLVRVAVYKNNHGTGSYQNNTIIVCGVEGLDGNAAIETSGTITFGVTFSAAPIVLISNAGAKSTNDGEVGVFFFSDFGFLWGTNIKNASTTTVSFDVRAETGYTLSTDHYYFSSWIAIGTIA
jgi:hypothetical protein